MALLVNKPLTIDMDGAVLLSNNAKGYIQVTGAGYPGFLNNYTQHRAPGAKSNIAAVRIEGTCDYTISDFDFKNQENGILTDNDAAGIIRLYDGSVTDGSLGYEQGKTHLIYIGEIAEFIAERVTLARHEYLGHLLKSRAVINTFTDLVINGETSAHSRCIDFPRGGTQTLTRCTVTQSPNSDNSDMMGFAREDVGEATTITLTDCSFTGGRGDAILFSAGGAMTWIDGGGNTFTGVSSIVEAHEGNIAVISERGVTRFTIRFPRTGDAGNIAMRG